MSSVDSSATCSVSHSVADGRSKPQDTSLTENAIAAHVDDSWRTADAGSHRENVGSCVVDGQLVSDMSADKQQPPQQSVGVTQLMDDAAVSAAHLCSLLANGCGSTVYDKLSLNDDGVKLSAGVGVVSSSVTKMSADEVEIEVSGSDKTIDELTADVSPIDNVKQCATSSEQIVSAQLLPGDANKLDTEAAERQCVVKSNGRQQPTCDIAADDVVNEVNGAVDSCVKLSTQNDCTATVHNTAHSVTSSCTDGDERSSLRELDDDEVSATAASERRLMLCDSAQQHVMMADGGTAVEKVMGVVEDGRSRAEDVTGGCEDGDVYCRDETAAETDESKQQDRCTVTSLSSVIDEDVTVRAADSDECCHVAVGQSENVVKTTNSLTTGQTLLTSRSNMSSSLQSLADLVQKVSTDLPYCTSTSATDAESGVDAVAMRNTPLYCGRVNYMTTGVTTPSGLMSDALALPHCTEEKTALSELKNPQLSHETDSELTSSSGPAAGVSHGDEAGTSGKLGRDKGEPGCKVERRRRKSSSGRCKDRVRKCKVDAVDVNFLKDLIVACSSYGSTDLAAKSSVANTTTCNNVTASAESEVNESTLSGGQMKHRKSSALRRKTTRLLSDITLIDVAAVNSCVEKDYTEFIRSIQTTTADNKTAMNDSKNRKKTAQTLVDKTMSAVSDSCQGRRPRKNVDVADEQSGKSSRSRNRKQRPRDDVQPRDEVLHDVLVDKRAEMHITKIAGDCVSPASANTAIPNCSVPAPGKRVQRKKKRCNASAAETEVSVSETRSQRRLARSSTRSRQLLQEPEIPLENIGDVSKVPLENIGDVLTGNDAARLKTSADGSATKVSSAKKKSRSSTRKLVALSEHCDNSSTIDHSTDHMVSRKSRKRKSVTQESSVTASGTLSEPELKHSRKKSPALQSVDVGTELVDAVDCQIQSNSSQQAQLESSKLSVVTPASKDQRQKKRRRKKAECFEAGNESSKTAQDETVVKEDSETKPCLSEAVMNDGVQHVTSAYQSVTSRDRDDVVACEESRPDDNTALRPGVVIATSKDEDAGEEKLFACVECSYKARKKGQLRKHLSVHKVFICAHCEFTTDSHGGLDEHMSIKHPSRCGRRLCKRCHMLFRAGSAFTQHVEQCTGTKLAWQCPTCAKNFKFVSAMRTHIQRWHNADHKEVTSGASDHRDNLSASNDAIADNVQVVSSHSVDSLELKTSTDVAVECTVTMSASGPAPSSAVRTAIVNVDNSLSTSSAVTTSLASDSATTSRTSAAGPGSVVMTSDELIRQTSSQPSTSSSAVNADGEVRYVCDHCPKSFKAKRSMVHHRRMIHEGGRERKKEAAGDAEKMKVGDGGSSERLSGEDVVTEDAAEKHTDKSSSSSSAAAAAVVRQVYCCSFDGCSHKFRRLEQLQRHEEKHAGPGVCVCLFVCMSICCNPHQQTTTCSVLQPVIKILNSLVD